MQLAPNQIIVKNDDGRFLKSYNAYVAGITPEGFVLGPKWDYSQTTLRYVYKFIQKFNNSIWVEIENSSNKKKVINKMIDNGDIKIKK